MFKASLDSLDPTVASILAPKKLLLWKSILAELGYSDMAVFDEVCQGVQLTGGAEVSGLFNLANKPATKSTQELRSSASQLSKDILQQVRPQSPDVDQVVLKKTQDEVAKGWVRGPLKSTQVPEGAVINRRFGLQQSTKVRLIDDFRPVNETVSSEKSPKPHTVDVLAAAVLETMLVPTSCALPLVDGCDGLARMLVVLL